MRIIFNVNTIYVDVFWNRYAGEMLQQNDEISCVCN